MLTAMQIIFFIISFVFTYLILKQIFKPKSKKKTELQIGFIDYEDNTENFYDEIFIEIKDTKIKQKINKKTLLIKQINGFKKSRIIEGKIVIRNSKNNDKKIFKILIYKNYTNDINIKINNSNKKYYYSEIIFYGDNINDKIKINNLSYNTFYLKKRIRIIICNIEKEELMKIIKDNYNNNELINKADLVLNNNSNQNLLINLFIGEEKSNLLIFKEEDQVILRPNKEEMKKFKKFYHIIYQNLSYSNSFDIKNACQNFIVSLYANKNLFGIPILDKDNKEKNDIYISFINQGINCLLENDIITKNDIDFMLGYLIILIYIIKNEEFKRCTVDFMLYYKDRIKKENFNEIEQIKIAIAYVIFSFNYSYEFDLKFIKDLDKNNKYSKGFNFYESIIKALNEDSEIMLLFLQLNSGFALELINNKICYKISMISINEIKEHLLINIPNYFFFYNAECDELIISDSRTQLLAFNETELFSSEESKENKEMNVVVGMFHEEGNLKVHMNIKVGSKSSPLLYIDKNYEIKIQKDEKKKTLKGEAGLCVDNYLYGYGISSAHIIRSQNSNQLKDINLFTGSLDKLNKKAKAITNKFFKVSTNKKDLNLNINDISCMRNPFKTEKKKKKEIEKDNIIINGKEFCCSLNVDI